MPDIATAAPTAAPAPEALMLFYGAHRTSPFTPRKAVIIDEVETIPEVPATDDAPGKPARRIVNVLVYNSAINDNGLPEVQQVRNVLVLPPGVKLVEGEETPWEWPALNFVCASTPETEPRPAPAPAAPEKDDAAPTPTPRRRRTAPAEAPAPAAP